MESKLICAPEPTLFVVGTKTISRPADGSICRAYPLDETVIGPGDRCLMASSTNGFQSALPVEFLDGRPYSDPGQTDSRQETFDTVMRTHFVVVRNLAQLAIPFIIADSSRSLFQYCGSISLSYANLEYDPGFDCAVAQADSWKIVTGQSDVETLRREVRQVFLETGDSIPISVRRNTDRVFGIIELASRRGDREFQCRFTTSSMLSTKENPFRVIRELRVKLLNRETGNLYIQSFQREFGFLALNEDNPTTD